MVRVAEVLVSQAGQRTGRSQVTRGSYLEEELDAESLFLIMSA